MEGKTRGTVLCVIIGLGLCAIGGMALGGSSSADPGYRDVMAGLGWFALIIGIPMFGISVLVELFSIRTALARTERALSLLYESRNSDKSGDLPRAA